MVRNATPLLALAAACATAGWGYATDPVAERVEFALEWGDVFVPESLRAPLGLTREALEADPPAPRANRASTQAPFDQARARAGRCLPTFVDDAGERTTPLAWVSFRLTPEGRGEAVVVRTSPGDPPASMVACVSDAISALRFPPPGTAGRVFLQVHGTGPEEPRDPPSAAGWTPPRMRVSDCFLHEVRVPRGALGESAFVHVKFAVTADGRVGLFHVLGDVSVPLAKAVRDAVYACEWEFAKDPSGTPSAMWVVIPLRFQGEERPQSLIRPWSGRNR